MDIQLLSRQGLGIKAISRKLGISRQHGKKIPKTVKRHARLQSQKHQAQ